MEGAPDEIPLPHGVVELQQPQTDAEQDFPDRNLNKVLTKSYPKVDIESVFHEHSEH